MPEEFDNLGAPRWGLLARRISAVNLNVESLFRRVENVNNYTQRIQNNTTYIRRDTTNIVNRDDRRIIISGDRTNQTVNNIDQRVLNLQEYVSIHLPEIKSSVENVDRSITNVNRSLNTKINQSRRTLEVTVNRNSENITNNVNNKTRESLTRINEININIENKLGDSNRAIITRIDRLDTTLERELIDLYSNLSALINRSRLLIIAAIEEINLLIIGLGQAIATLDTYLVVTLGGLAAELAGFTFTLAKIESSILYNRSIINREANNINNQISKEHRNTKNIVISAIRKTIQEENTELTKKLEDLEKSVKEKSDSIKKQIEKLGETLGEQVALHIVGESYIKWDSQVSYFPTLVFLFKEVGLSIYPRKVQLKVRLKEKNEEVTKELLERLKSKVASLNSLSFKHGVTRANYVSADRRFKTTVYCEEAADAEKVLFSICSIIEEDFKKENLSITLASKRTNYLRRTKKLDTIDINTVEYKTTIVVELFKVILLINGLEKPIQIKKKCLTNLTFKT